MSEHEEAEYGLVMPFVVCPPDGPYDDAAFAAGWDMGGLDAELKMCVAMPLGIPAIPSPRYVKTPLLPQIDLVAMRHGYEVTTGDEAEGGYTWLTFSRSELGGDAE